MQLVSIHLYTNDLTAAGRNWFPTRTPAQHFPGKVTISHQGMLPTFDL